MRDTPGICRDARAISLSVKWLLKLHTFGLLNNSFQPSDAVRAVRTLWRHRAGLVAQASSAIQRMQKAMIEMNIQLSNVLSDLSGVSGMAIVQAILEGQREPRKLAALADPQVKASKAVIAKNLRGNWRPELLFALSQEGELSGVSGQDRCLRLGAQYRRLRTRLGAPKAITAMARKIACLFYRLLTKGQQYVDKGAAYYETRHHVQQVRSLIKRAKQLGMQVVQLQGEA